MSFIAVCLALLIEQARPLAPGNAVHAAARAWVRACMRNLDAGRAVHAWLIWCCAVGGPTLLVGVMHGVCLVYGGWMLALLWSVLVLYATLGFRQFSTRFAQVRDALVQGDEAKAREALTRWVGEPPTEPMVGTLIEVSALAAHRHVFGTLLFFSVGAALGLGPTGAVLYRLAELIPRYSAHKSLTLTVSANSLGVARQMWQVLDWLPVRVTAVAFAVVGNFEETIDAWRQLARMAPPDNDTLLLAATAGALNVQLPHLRRYGAEGGTERLAPDLPQVSWLIGLLWRCVVLWVLMLALLTLARLLG